MGLAIIGDVSDPVPLSYGVALYRYMGDVPCGAYEPTQEEWEALRFTARENKQFQYLDMLVADWKPQYPIEIHSELLSMR